MEPVGGSLQHCCSYGGRPRELMRSMGQSCKEEGICRKLSIAALEGIREMELEGRAVYTVHLKNREEWCWLLEGGITAGVGNRREGGVLICLMSMATYHHIIQMHFNLL